MFSYLFMHYDKCSQWRPFQDLRVGFPPGLKYISLDGGRISDVMSFLEKYMPPTVRLARINDKFHTVTWRFPAASTTSTSTSTTNTAGRNNANIESAAQVGDLQEWPERRALLHMDEWLEWLDCEDAAWAVQATRSHK